MNSENTEIVDRMNANFLWHSNNALRKELLKTQKELASLKMKIKDLH